MCFGQKKPTRLPVVLTRQEVYSVLQQLTGLPQTAVPALHTQLQTTHKLHYQDLEAGNGRVSLANAPAQKHPKSSSRHPAMSSSHIPSPAKPGSNAACHPPGWVRTLVRLPSIVPDGADGILLKRC